MTLTVPRTTETRRSLGRNSQQEGTLVIPARSSHTCTFKVFQARGLIYWTSMGPGQSVGFHEEHGKRITGHEVAVCFYTIMKLVTWQPRVCWRVEDLEQRIRGGLDSV